MRSIISIIISFILLGTCQAATVVTTGIEGKLKETMEGLMRPRLEFIQARSATEWRADDAAFFLKELLVKRGYAECSVDWKLPGNNVILLKADLGVQYVIGRIYTTTKNPITEELLDDYFCQPVLQSGYYSREDAPYLEGYPADGATNIANYLKSEGYWDANVSVASVAKKKDGKVDIRLNINRGKLHQILPPKFTGVSPEHRAQITAIAAPFIGKTATTVNITELNNAINQFYRDQDYEFAKINADSNNIHGIEITFSIEAGNRYRVRKVFVKGNQETKSRRFNRYVEPLINEVYDESKANDVAKKLLLTGAFEVVRMIPEKVNGSELDLILEVREARPRFVRAYAGVASYDGFILGASYTNQNFMKKLQTLNVRSEVSSRGLLGEVSLTEPYFAGENISQTTRFYALQRRFDGYKKSLTGVETSFTWKPTNYYAAKLSGGLDYVRSNSAVLTDAELGPKDYLNTRVTLEQTLDLRDNPVLPTEGLYAKFLLEQGTVSGDSSNNYFRSDINTSYRFPLENNSRVVVRFGAGAIFPADSQDLPIDLRLFSGGADSVRSFGERDLGPLALSGDPLGGEAYWAASAEYVQPFNDLFSGVIFVDAGNVFTEASDFSFSDPSYAAGLGFRIDLPVGPVRFEYGFNLNQKPGEPSGAFHFSIGTQF